MVADYEFYLSTFMGTALSEEEFPKCAVRADAYLNELTFGRFADDSLPDKVKEAVKMAECAVAEQYQVAEKAETAGAGVISSETVGEHSRSFRSGEEIQRQTDAKISRTAQRYLGWTGLLYRGVPLCMHHTRYL